MAEPICAGGHEGGMCVTTREDNWWVGPLVTFIGFTGFVIYATWAGFQGAYYFAAPYLSPMYSPLLWEVPNAVGGTGLHHAWLGAWPAWWPAFLPASPAFLIVGFPLAFRFTCYYYRKAYYRSFCATPPGCAVNARPQGQYKGETVFLLFQNLHRYALYCAIAFIFILSYDAVLAFSKDGKFGFGVGTFIMVINPILIAAYTFGCHSFRHLLGGRKNSFSCKGGKPTLSYLLWTRISKLNENHMLFAWMSLCWVWFTDVYIRLVSMGIWHDINTWGN